MEPLRREVLPPRSWAATRGVAWLGPLFVLGSTLALAMAMAAMALSPRPHLHHARHHRAIELRPAQARVLDEARVLHDVRALDAELRARCGAPVYRAGTDALVDVRYELCPPTTP